MLKSRRAPSRAHATEAKASSHRFVDGTEPVSQEAMFVIVFGAPTSGTGKTTLCSQLAVQADIVGAGPLALIDTDTRRCLSAWRKARQLETPAVIASTPACLFDDIEALRKRRTALVFIDTPPTKPDTLAAIVGLADLVVIPTCPDPDDQWSPDAIGEFLAPLSKPLVFVVNGAVAGGGAPAQALAQPRYGAVAPIAVGWRNEFAASLIEGGAVAETDPGSIAASEINELWRYLSARVHKVERRTQSLPFVGQERRAAPSAEPAGGAPAERKSGGRGAA